MKVNETASQIVYLYRMWSWILLKMIFNCYFSPIKFLKIHFEKILGYLMVEQHIFIKNLWRNTVYHMTNYHCEFPSLLLQCPIKSYFPYKIKVELVPDCRRAYTPYRYNFLCITFPLLCKIRIKQCASTPIL